MKTIEIVKRNMPKCSLIVYLLLAFIILGCKKDDAPPITPVTVIESAPEEEPVLSSEKQLIGFRFTGIENNGVTVDIPGEIDELGKTIALEMPSGTEINALEPNLEIPDMAVYEPTGLQDFSTPINYTITAEDGTSSTYLVTIDVALSQKEILLLISAANPENTLDWKETDNLSDWEEVTLDANGIITELALSQRKLSQLPPEIGQLTNLKVFVLNFNQLTSLPPEIGKLGNLVTLDLTYNNLSNMPSDIGQLGSLEYLNLGENDLRSLPSEIGQLSSLIELRLYNNDLNSLPPEIGQLSRLVALGLYINNLSSLPPEIGQLGSLENLNLGGNDLSSLPQEIGQLASLEKLNLFNNELSGLPIEMNQLVNLKTLYLSSNNLSEFDHVPFIPSGGIGDITIGCATETNLEELTLSGNPGLEVLDQCICDLDLDMGGTINIDVVPNRVECKSSDVIGN